MKKMSILIGIFTVFLLNCFVLSAYSKRKNIYNLNETSWELVQINRNGKNVEIPKGGKVTINFSGDKINGFSGINNYFGNYNNKAKWLLIAVQVLPGHAPANLAQ